MNRLGLIPLILVLTSAISWNLFALSSVQGTHLLLDEPTFTKALPTRPTWKPDSVWLPLGPPEITKNANLNFAILDVRGDSIQS